MQIIENEPMSNHTTFKVGGEARYYLITESFADVKAALEYAENMSLPYYIVGRGSNLLFSDKPYEGVVIEIGSGLSEFNITGTTVEAFAGVSLSSLAKKTADAGLTGLEFAAGIPGTVGGAVVMNAGAYDGQIKDVIKEVTVISEEGDIYMLEPDELNLSYRHSIFQENDEIVLSAMFELQPGNKEEITAKIKELNNKRKEKQPLEYPSAGSTFKRPEGYFAGKLIQDAGLRGYSIGGAQVSEKHCGFVINKGDATADDIYNLIQHVSSVVHDKFGVELEPEVRMVGFDNSF
ncbi:MAG: UDP-N-acetylmuramate dehydrogenase [Eubacterium sp.]|nr:UDP-N-acetylmuramate dehydrogenase [Eubacterium sp.]